MSLNFYVPKQLLDALKESPTQSLAENIQALLDHCQQEIKECHEITANAAQAEEDLTWMLCKLVEQLGGPKTCGWKEFNQIPERIEKILAVVDAAKWLRRGPEDCEYFPGYAGRKLDYALNELAALEWKKEKTQDEVAT